MEEQVQKVQQEMEERRKQPSRLEVIGAVLTIGVLGFCLGLEPL